MNNSYLKSKTFLVPTALVVVFICVHVILLTMGNPKYYNLSRTLTQWDGQHYLSIARDGYEMFPCWFGRGYICGNVGWFPLLPMIGRIVAVPGIAHDWALILVSWLAFLIGTLMLYRLIESKYGERTAMLSTVAMLVFPGAFYFLTAFPNALYLMLAVLIFVLIEQRRYLWLWIPAGMLAVAHPSGSVIGLPLLYLFVRDWKSNTARERLLLFAAMAAMASAIAIYFSYYAVTFGDFFLYSKFQAQSYYAHEVTFPLIPVVQLFMQPSVDYPAFAMLAFVIAVVAVFYRRTIPVSWQVFMFGLLLFSPTMGTTDSYFRYVEAAFPMFAMVGLRAQSRSGKYFYGLYVLAALILWWFVFLNAFKAGQLR